MFTVGNRIPLWKGTVFTWENTLLSGWRWKVGFLPIERGEGTGTWGGVRATPESREGGSGGPGGFASDSELSMRSLWPPVSPNASAVSCRHRRPGTPGWCGAGRAPTGAGWRCYTEEGALPQRTQGSRTLLLRLRGPRGWDLVGICRNMLPHEKDEGFRFICLPLRGQEDPRGL